MESGEGKSKHMPSGIYIRKSKTGKDTTYTPDFYLQEFDLWIEIKGWLRADAKEKMRNFKNKYPEINLQIWRKDDLENKSIISYRGLYGKNSS
jgi:hypothetical protein